MSERRNPMVDAWFAQTDNPLKAEMMRVREAILDADQRMTEVVKWSTPTFVYKGNLLSFQPRAKRFVSLLFHEGASIPGEHPHLEGDGAHARTMRIPPGGNVDALLKELARVVRSWCEMKDSI
jgi:hypothetical protein